MRWGGGEEGVVEGYLSVVEGDASALVGRLSQPHRHVWKRNSAC